MVAHIYYPDTQKAGTGLFKVQCQPEYIVGIRLAWATRQCERLVSVSFFLSLSLTQRKKKEVEEGRSTNGY